jgi:putative toxin-antitoxin system antitoxin component (TIGR02293 family)
MRTKTAIPASLELVDANHRRHWSEKRLLATWGLSDSRTLLDRYAVVLNNLTGQALPETSVGTIRQVLHDGLKPAAFSRLQQALGITPKLLAEVMGVNLRGLAHRTRLRADESERLLRVATVFQRTLEVFGDLATARRWFVSEKAELGNKSPLEFCDTDPGTREVEQLLGRIAHGVFA